MPEVQAQAARGARSARHVGVPGRLLLLPPALVSGRDRAAQALLKADPGFTSATRVYYYLAEALLKVKLDAEAVPYFDRLVKEFETSEFLDGEGAAGGVQERRCTAAHRRAATPARPRGAATPQTQASHPAPTDSAPAPADPPHAKPPTPHALLRRTSASAPASSGLADAAADPLGGHGLANAR